ncbi:MAG: DUF1905 domain-containing protein [Ilumatobacteraceae bacterium]
MSLSFSGTVWEWRGPAPFHFVSVPPEGVEQIQEVASGVTYGWGMIPVAVTIGGTTWTTSLWPKNGGYVVPLKDRVRDAEEIDLDDVVEVHLEVVQRRGRR